MANALAIGSNVAGGGSTGGAGVAPGNVLGITVTGFIDPNTLAVTLQVSVVPPSDGGDSITACHLYLECPDVSSGTPFTVGTSTLSGADPLSGPWAPIDCGVYPIAQLIAGTTVTVPGPPGINASVDIPSRLYANSVSAKGENPLVEANQPSPTPSQTFTLVSLASGTPTSGTNITTLSIAAGGLVTITATALAPVNVTGVLETPVEVIVADTPTTPGWCYQLVITYAGTDPTVAANQFIAAKGPFTQAGIVGQSLYELASADGVSVPHSFLLKTPTVVTKATVWLQAGLVNADGIFQGNNIVPGVTPSFPITYGSTVGTTDASAIMTATIAMSMAVVNGLFGVAAAGITNTLLGSGAVATINIQALAVTNPLLASLAVEAANLATGSVTSTAIAALAVGTGAIQTAAITNALIANLAVSGAQIQSATITGANIASATIAGANIGTATIAQANMASASIGTAQIQNPAVTNAQINDLSASKLTAGTISATISITSPTITATNGFTVTAGGITTTISNGTFGGAPAGMFVEDGSAFGSAHYPNGVSIGTFNASAFYATLGVTTQISPTENCGYLLLSDSLGSYSFELIAHNMTTSSASSGGDSLPSNPAGFLVVKINSTIQKIPYYNS